MSEDEFIAPQYERYPDSVPGPFYVVKDLCLICEFPLLLAPKNVSWTLETENYGHHGECPTHCRVSKQPETPEELNQMIEAVKGSCVEAIRYCGTNPEVIERLVNLGAGHLCDALCDSGEGAGDP